jgi:twitching motility protein PilT
MPHHARRVDRRHRLADPAAHRRRQGRVAANEILLRSSGLPDVIREGNTPMITRIIQSGKAQGMQLMDEALLALVQSGKVSGRDAYTKATNKSKFEEFVKEG